LFQAESRRCKEILDAIFETDDKRHFCVFDELYSGTNPEEATKSAYAFLLYLSKYKNVNFILTTHYVSVCKRLRKVPTVKNWKMEAHETAEGELRYTYKIAQGISQIQGAFSVLREMGYPAEILDTIRDYDRDHDKKKKKGKNKKIASH
jgi:DNA mismatch repair ATPase MutS